jgi:hypothetical protein
MRAASVLVLGLVLSVSCIARAQEQPGELEPPPRIELALDGEWPEPLRVALRADLGASLRGQGLELVHAADGAGRVIATVRVDVPTEDSPRAAVRIEDRITGKHVERTVELRRVPPDGWSVAIAAGADELLRASWAELTVAGAPAPVIEPPPAVEAIVEERIVTPIVERHLEEALSPPQRRPALSLGVRAALEGYNGGQVHVGGDLMVQIWLIDRLGIELAFGGRGGLDHEAARGRVRSWALGGELGLVALLVSPPSAIRVETFAVVRTSYVAFDAEANTGSIARDSVGLAVFGRAGLRAGAAIDRGSVGAELSVGGPFLALDATDERGAVTGASGIELHAAVYAAFEVAP